jgi:hypothetical protein
MQYFNKKMSFLLLIIVMSLVVFPSCGGNATTSKTSTTTMITKTSAPAQQELQPILTNSVAAMKKVDTYTFYIYTGTEMETTGGSQPGKADFESTMTGASNRKTNQMFITINNYLDGDIKWANAVSHKTSEEIYLLENSLYVYTELVPIGKQWLKTPLSDQMKNTYMLNSVSHQLAPLESVKDLKFERYEILDGTQCYVLTMIPDALEIMGWVVEDLPARINTDITTERVVKIFKDISYTIWITRDTGLMKNMDAKLRLEMNYDDFDALEAITFDKFTMDITVSVKIFDHNKPVYIVLPPEARNAMEIPAPTQN